MDERRPGLMQKAMCFEVADDGAIAELAKVFALAYVRAERARIQRHQSARRLAWDRDGALADLLVACGLGSGRQLVQVDGSRYL